VGAPASAFIIHLLTLLSAANGKKTPLKWALITGASNRTQAGGDIDLKKCLFHTQPDNHVQITVG